MKYRKKPVVIEAYQLTRKYFDVVENWVIDNGGIIHARNNGEFEEDSCYIEIDTLKGRIMASEFDYIIRGIKNEFYPCKPDIFEATYEKVEE